MNIVDQVISAVEASAKVAWSVFFACLAAIAVEFYQPRFFDGLPEWILPTIHIVALFTLVLSFASIIWPTIGHIKSFWNYLLRPQRTKSTRMELLNISVTELAILSKALAQGDRTVWLKPDLAQAINLQDKGLIQIFWTGFIPSDGTSSFEVPKDVWRVMLSMDEFRNFDPSNLIRVLTPNQGATEAMILAALPQGHPAVRGPSPTQGSA